MQPGAGGVYFLGHLKIFLVGTFWNLRAVAMDLKILPKCWYLFILALQLS